MSFQQALSGLSAASRGLDVIGNNIANANTVGAKSARAEFTDIYAASMSAGNSMALGVRVATVAQNFKQGNITTTGNALDMALNGNGFFQVQQADGSAAYTRDGQFKLDKNGYMVSNTGAKLMGYPTDVNGATSSTTATSIQLPAGGTIAPKATTAITAQFNLDARVKAASASTPAAVPTQTTLNQASTTLMTYDAQGIEVPVSLYFFKASPNTWDVYASTNGAPVFDNTGAVIPARKLATSLSFDANGNITNNPTTQTLAVTDNAGTAVTPARTYTLDFAKTTQLGTNFSVSTLTQDGYAPGELNGIAIGNDGVIRANYSNGQRQGIAQVMVANFRNLQGLTPIGNGMWTESNSSGTAVRGAPGSNGLATLQSGALEESNVDLTAELVNMMTAQRTYQANAQTIKTQDQVTSTILNMR